MEESFYDSINLKYMKFKGIRLRDISDQSDREVFTNNLKDLQNLLLLQVSFNLIFGNITFSSDHVKLQCWRSRSTN